MTPASSVDEQSFRTLLSRNVALPLSVGVLSAVFFVCLITYLLSVIQWVEHTDRVINNLNESSKLTVDLETGMRGFLITGDERFLDPYEVAKPRIFASLDSLRELVADNPAQVDRCQEVLRTHGPGHAAHPRHAATPCAGPSPDDAAPHPFAGRTLWRP